MAQDKPRNLLQGDGLGQVKVHGTQLNPQVSGNHGEGGQQAGGRAGGGHRLSAGGRQGGGGAQGAEPMIQERDAQDQRKSLQSSACRHPWSHCGGLWEAGDGHMSKSTQGTCASQPPADSITQTERHLLGSKSAGGQSSRERLDSSQGEAEFPERELGLLCHLRSPNAASPPTLPPGLPSPLLPSLLLSSPISLPSSLHPSLGWSEFSQRIVCNLCACVSVRVYLQCMYKPVCACPYCEHSSVPVHAQYPHHTHIHAMCA